MRRIALLGSVLAVLVFCGCEGSQIQKLDEVKAAFEYEDVAYELHLCEGEDARLGVYVAEVDKDGVSCPEEYQRDVEEPIYGQVKIEELYIEETGMKFVYGKVFGKRYKPYLNGKAFGRLDRNNMFFYAAEEDESVDILYR